VLTLNALSLNVTPILAGAGIATVVIGLSAQPLINDIVSGFFILFENMFLVGDYIETGDARGVVEAIDIRTTRIRDPDGQQHILRNGQINDIVSFSKKYTFAVVQVGVAYESDLDHDYAVLKQAGIDLKLNDKNVIAPTEVQGLQDFGASELTIRTVTRVKPGRHLQVERDYRKLVKEAFDREGIEIPFAQRVITFKEGPVLAQIGAETDTAANMERSEGTAP
jgi:small conductance mechanosensitive channel